MTGADSFLVVLTPKPPLNYAHGNHHKRVHECNLYLGISAKRRLRSLGLVYVMHEVLVQLPRAQLFVFAAYHIRYGFVVK